MEEKKSWLNARNITMAVVVFVVAIGMFFIGRNTSTFTGLVATPPPPTISQISPRTITVGTSPEITLTGTNLRGATYVQIQTRDGAKLADTTITSRAATTLKFKINNVNFAGTSLKIVVATRSGTATNPTGAAGSFSSYMPLQTDVAVSSLAGSGGIQEVRDMHPEGGDIVSIHGLNLDKVTSVQLFAPLTNATLTIPATRYSYKTATKIELDLLKTNFAEGLYLLKLNGIVIAHDEFVFTTALDIQRMAPTELKVGEVTSATLLGTFDTGQTFEAVLASDPTKKYPLPVTSQPNKFRAEVSVPSTLPVGFYYVQFTNQSDTSIHFEVESAEEFTAPAVTSISHTLYEKNGTAPLVVRTNLTSQQMGENTNVVFVNADTGRSTINYIARKDGNTYYFDLTVEAYDYFPADGTYYLALQYFDPTSGYRHSKLTSETVKLVRRAKIDSLSPQPVTSLQKLKITGDYLDKFTSLTLRQCPTCTLFTWNSTSTSVTKSAKEILLTVPQTPTASTYTLSITRDGVTTTKENVSIVR